jgi:type VI secretion system protein ImpL
MGKIFGAIFNRWTLLAVLLLALLAVIWIIGPLVAVGNWRPLESTTARWVATGVVLLGTLAVVIWRIVKAKLGNNKVVNQLAAAPPAAAAESAEMQAVRQRFADALATLKNARFGAEQQGGAFASLKNKLGGRYLYQLPWYLIIGAPGSGKTTALQNAGLQFPLAATHGSKAVRGVGGTRLCDWWFTDRAVLIDTAGRFTTQDSDAANDKATWGGFLQMLKGSRARQPLNGVLVTVSVADLIGRSAAEREQHALAVRQRLQELHQQLKLKLPIYLMVSKCDLLAGFAETFDALDKEQRATPWGFTFPLQPAAAWAEQLEPQFKALLTRLDQGLIDRLQGEPDRARRARIYGFPNQFANLQSALTDFAQQVFAPSPFEANPLLRGVYFISGTQEGTPIDRVLGAAARRFRIEQNLLPAQQGSGRSFFLQRLLTDVVFAEQGLATTDKSWERRRSVGVIAAYALLGLFTVGLLAAWGVSWNNNRQYIDTVTQRVEGVRRLVQETPNRATADLLPLLPALEGTRKLAADSESSEREAGAGVPWSLGFGLYQGNKLDGAASDTYGRMLGDAVLPRLALRVEEQLRLGDQADSQYEALKAYLMLYDVERFEANALKDHVENDWEARLGREIAPEQRDALSRHLDALLQRGAAVSPLPQDKALIDATRTRLASVPLQQRVYNRLRQRGLGAEFPEVTVVSAGGPNAQNVFVRASGLPLASRGVPGLFTYDGYHKGFQKVVDDTTKTLAEEQSWVLGIAPAQGQADALLNSARLGNDVRRLYLNDYRDAWKAFIADIKLQPLQSMSGAIEKTRFLSGLDSPLPPLLKTFSKHTTLLAAQPGVVGSASSKIDEALRSGQKAIRDALGTKPASTGAPGERIESIVDDEFKQLRSLVVAPEGGKAPIEGLVARLQELQIFLTGADAALKAKSPPPASPLPTQLKVEGANSPEPLRALLEQLGNAASNITRIQLRSALSDRVRSEIGEFCNQAINGRYPFDPAAVKEVTPADFAQLFGPGGRFERVQAELTQYIDTSVRPWRFRAVDGVPLGGDLGTLPQFQRAQAIREAYFSTGGNTPGVRLMMKPVEMDTKLREFLLDVDGQLVRYDHGPQIPVEVKWPGPKGTGVVRVSVQPAGGTGMVNDGPWALFRLFERVAITPGISPEKFKATFDIDGRKAVFDVTNSSVRNPMRMPEIRGFACPNGL